MSTKLPFTRRKFLQISAAAGGGLLVSFAWPHTTSGAEEQLEASLNAYIRIAPDGSIRTIWESPGKIALALLPRPDGEIWIGRSTTTEILYRDSSYKQMVNLKEVNRKSKLVREVHYTYNNFVRIKKEIYTDGITNKKLWSNFVYSSTEN